MLSFDVRYRGWLFCFWLIAAWLVYTFPAVRAQAPDSIHLPLPVPKNNIQILPYSVQSGLQLDLNADWAGNAGYWPVQCTVKCSTAAAAETLITVRFLAGNYDHLTPAMSVEKQFRLPAGKTSATTTLSVPQFWQWQYIGCETWVDGAYDPQLSLERAPRSARTNQTCSVLALGNVNSTRISDLLMHVQGTQPNFLSKKDLRAFDRWIHFTTLDLVVTNLSTLDKQQAQYPGAFNELLKWVRAGGNLWITDGGDDFRNLGAIDACLSGKPKNPSKSSDEASLLARGWRYARLNNSNSNPVDEYLELTARYSQLEVPSKKFVVADQPASDSKRWFTVRPLGLGLVCAFKSLAGPRELIVEVAFAVNQTVVAHRLPWHARHGNDPGAGNDCFNDFLIPDVGAAPVTAFQVLLSLFVLGIGPLNYWLLKRRHQLPYLLLTVPAAALATIFILLAYSYLSDGFSSLVRARSITLLDQRAGTATCWARLSYFAGLPPKELQMPGDTVIYPIYPSGRSGNHRLLMRYVRQPRELQWSGGQHLTRGWLMSRTPTQYLTISSRETERRLEIQEIGTDIDVANNLGVSLVFLVVEDEQGSIYVGEQIPVDGQMRLNSATQVESMMKLRSVFSDNEPQFPPGTLDALAYIGQAVQRPLSTNLMEVQLSSIVAPTSKGWGGRTFVAVTNEGMDLSLGNKQFKETSSFHVVRGTW